MPFGDFTSICAQAALPLCPLVGTSPFEPSTPGLPATCYSRSISLANTTIFAGATGCIHIIALLMTTIMILHVRSKFTAVGRKEIAMFFYLYMLLTVLSLVLDCGVVPPGSKVKPYFVSLQLAVAGGTCICLMVNGFVGFQLYEDGTTLSLWLLRGVTGLWGLITFLVALFTFNSLAGLNPTRTIPLYILVYPLNALFLLIYTLCQLLLVTHTLQDRWPLGDIAFGLFFFVIGQTMLYALGEGICTGAQHYFDGVVFATVANLLAVMMVYKFWDSITTEDLEFSVGAKVGNWDVKQVKGMGVGGMGGGVYGMQHQQYGGGYGGDGGDVSPYHDDVNASTVGVVGGGKAKGLSSAPPVIRHSYVDNL